MHDLVQLSAPAEQAGERLSDVLAQCVQDNISECVTLGAIVAALGERSIETLLLCPRASHGGAVGLFERDGIVVTLGLAVAVAGLVIVTIASAGAADVLGHWWRG